MAKPAAAGGAPATPEKKGKKKTFKKKERKHVSHGIAHIQASFNNTIVTENSVIHDLGAERRLWNQFIHQMGNIFLTLGSEGLLIAGSAAKGDHDCLLSSRQGGRPQRSKPE